MNNTSISLDALAPYVRKAGLQENKQWRGKLRRIYDHQWMFVTNGKAYYQENGQVIHLLPGTLLLIEPGIPHGFWLDENMESEIKWVHFDFEYREDVYDLDSMLNRGSGHLFNETGIDQNYIRSHYVFDGFSLPRTMEIDDIESVDQLFNDIIETYDRHNLSWQLQARADWLQIMTHVINLLQEEKKNVGSVNSSELVKNICNYIDNNYHNRLTRNNLANFFGYHPDYLGKRFKEEMGQSISSYINNLRIDKGKSLLTGTKLSVQNISELVGFSDVFYFSKKMKVITGHSPSYYRKS